MATFATITRDNGETLDLNLDAIAYVVRDKKGARLQFAVEEAMFLMLTPGEMKQLVPLIAPPKPAPSTHPVTMAIF